LRKEGEALVSTIETNLAESKLASSKEYREAFVASFLKRYIPFQIRTIRKKRKMSQSDLAEAAKITQGVISRAEDPDYGNLTFNTVLRTAAGFDLAFIGKFVRFSEFQKIVDEMSEDACDLPGFVEECEAEAAAATKKRTVDLATLANAGAGDDLSWLGNSQNVASQIIAAYRPAYPPAYPPAYADAYPGTTLGALAQAKKIEPRVSTSSVIDIGAYRQSNEKLETSAQIPTPVVRSEVDDAA
jgi:transcriptional regulator with XRE-family HTH domain